MLLFHLSVLCGPIRYFLKSMENESFQFSFHFIKKLSSIESLWWLKLKHKEQEVLSNWSLSNRHHYSLQSHRMRIHPLQCPSQISSLFPFLIVHFPFLFPFDNCNNEEVQSIILNLINLKQIPVLFQVSLFYQTLQCEITPLFFFDFKILNHSLTHFVKWNEFIFINNSNTLSSLRSLFFK